jgi:GT2 family glycosyltransferase
VWVVQDIEVTQPLPAVVDSGPDGSAITRALLLVRLCTEPLGVLRLDMPAGGLTAQAVGEALGVQYGGALAQRLGADALATGAVPVTGLPAPTCSSYVDVRDQVLARAPEITVVVCTRDRPDSLRRTLDSLGEQRYPRFRVLVVDNGLDRATADVVRAAARGLAVEYLPVVQPGLARARNAAVAAAAGQTVAWLDDDEVADRNWLAEIARGLAEHPDADVLCGAVVPAELATTAQIWFEQFGGLVKGRGFTSAVFSPQTRDTFHPLFPLPPWGAGANMVTRPGVVERVGGFDPALGAGSPAMGGEDTLFFMEVLRGGGTLVYLPAILARHYHRRDVAGLRSQLVGYGTGLTAAYTALVRRHPLEAARLPAIAGRAARELWGSGGHRTASIEADFPRELLRANRRAMVCGPLAYLRGRRRHLRAAGTNSRP